MAREAFFDINRDKLICLDEVQRLPELFAVLRGVIEHILTALPQWRAGFFCLTSGAEIDLVLQRGRRRVAIECKAFSSPAVARGFWNGLADLNISTAYVVAPVREGYPLKDGVKVMSLGECLYTLGASLWPALSLLRSDPSSSNTSVPRAIQRDSYDGHVRL